MGRRSKQTILQRRYTDGRETHEKMFNITHHQRNANQNQYEVPTTLHQPEWPSSKSLQTISAGEGVEKKEPYYTVDGNVNWCKHYRKHYGDSSEN